VTGRALSRLPIAAAAAEPGWTGEPVVFGSALTGVVCSECVALGLWLAHRPTAQAGQ